MCVYVRLRASLCACLGELSFVYVSSCMANKFFCVCACMCAHWFSFEVGMFFLCHAFTHRDPKMNIDKLKEEHSTN